MRSHGRGLYYEPMNEHMHDVAQYADIKTYADLKGVTPRTVNNWLAAGRLDGAEKDHTGRWLIPVDATPGRAAAMIARRPDTAPDPRPAADLVVVREAAPPPRPLFNPKARPFPIADVAAEYGVPVETVRRWAKAGDGGLSLSTGPTGAHYVWIESA